MNAAMADVLPERAVRIPIDHDSLPADLVVPEGARAVVLFAHGSGSGRRSPRNREVAHFLQEAGLATLLVDLLTPGEAARDSRTAEHRFDIELLGSRMGVATRWLAAEPETSSLAQGYYGASTGAAAALVAAAAHPKLARAIVSRGGRPDLATDDELAHVRAPTLFVVGGEDAIVAELNRTTLAKLRCEKAMEVVPGASHLFEEPGAMATVARLARDWFSRHLLEDHSATGRAGGL